MYCEKCGKRIREEYGYCYKCGHVFDESKGVSHQPEPQPQYQAQPQYQPEPQYQQPQYQQPQYQPEPQPQQYAPAQKKITAFPFVSAGIMIMMILFSFLPWMNIAGINFNIIQFTFAGSVLGSVVDFGDAIGVLMTMFICVMVSNCLCIPGTVLSFVKKKNLALGINIAASVLAIIPPFIYLIAVGIAPYCNPTAFLIFYLVFAIGNIVFSAIARKKG